MRFSSIFACCITPCFVMAGPFGSEMGMSLSEMRKIGNIENTERPFIYRSKSMTNGYPDAEVYTFIITPKSGLCKISVATKNISTSSFGTELNSKFNEIKSALSEKYGNATNDYDFLKSGSIWKERNDWMMALLKKERILTSYWTEKELIDNIKSISVEAVALKSDTGYISFGYEYNNLSECMIELRSNQNKNM